MPTDLPSQPKQIKTKQAKTGKVKRTKAGVVKDFVPVENRSYSGRQLMKRFKCGDRLLRIRRSQPDFADWSKQRDPEGVVWKYQDDNFFPQLG